MSTDHATEPTTDERTKWSPWAIAAAVLLLLIFGVIAVGTLRGCFFVDPQEAAKHGRRRKRRKRKRRRKKAEFEISSPIVMPSEPKVAAAAGEAGPLGDRQPGDAGQLSRLRRRLAAVDRRQPEPALPGRQHAVQRARQPAGAADQRPAKVDRDHVLRSAKPAKRSGSRPSSKSAAWASALPQPRTPLTPMPSYQYHFVVLAKEPSRYSFIKSLDSVKVPFDGESDADDTEDPLHLPRRATGRRPDRSRCPTIRSPGPASPTCCGTKSIRANRSRPSKKKALVDWLHWGGQLIISGPDSLDLLKGSFLEPYLPATSGGPRKIAADDPAIAELNEHWMISTPKRAGRTAQAERALVGRSNSTLHAGREAACPTPADCWSSARSAAGGSSFPPCSFPSATSSIGARGFESLFNACLLRRPPRKYQPGYFGDVTLAWADDELKDRRLDARAQHQPPLLRPRPGRRHGLPLRRRADDDSNHESAIQPAAASR